MSLPKYTRSQIVKAGKITEIIYHEAGGLMTRLVFKDIDEHAMVDDVWLDRFKPIVGGYYLIDEIGATFYFPAKAFEGVYIKIVSSNAPLTETK